jgi:tetratricopeptide (TPR) repeat protein
MISRTRIAVKAWSEEVNIPTYAPAEPDKNPMFLERRVYQGSCGTVYPLPFYDRISETRTDRAWTGVWLENEFLKVLILPQIGGRIHSILDKANGYEALYRQDTIKPALVGLAGPWISGGIEFNWPQHHRPATFMPVDFDIEYHEDGSATAWFSDHDPLLRMKGMHGVCLHPDRSYLELKVRLYNRTPLTQTFLWWANMGVRVDSTYQSIFPPDVHWVADHAKRAVSDFPSCTTTYYGVDYSPGTRLDWFENIPVPTSYMAIGTQFDFVGGYDHTRKAGLLHIANHHISPGKKQWTWGNSDFGNRWYEHLADDGGRYIEIMAGVYTENQPDFSFLAPGETKRFSQFWYPIRGIGIPQAANTDAALSVNVQNGVARIGLIATSDRQSASIAVYSCQKLVYRETHDLFASQPYFTELPVSETIAQTDLNVIVTDRSGAVMIDFDGAALTKETDPLVPATEPDAPAAIESNDELYITGLHLEQYRHPTRSPEPYWQEALRRDPGDSRCNNAMGLRSLRRGEFDKAIEYFNAAIARATRRNPNPYDGEPFYNLGLALRYTGDLAGAYAAFYKATWNAALVSPAYFELAQIECINGNFVQALDHLDRSLAKNQDHLKARNLRSMILRKLGRKDEARCEIDAVIGIDKLDWWSQYWAGSELTCDTQTKIDLALDLLGGGFAHDAVEVLNNALKHPDLGATPMLHYHLGLIFHELGEAAMSETELRLACEQSPDYCFPARLEDMIALNWAIQANPTDGRAPYYLGNLLYNFRRHADAIESWERSARIDPTNAIVWRNLGIAYFNIRDDAQAAKDAYDKAFEINPSDARLCYERDQLAKRIGADLNERIAFLEENRALVARRDDLSLELCALYNQVSRPGEARDILESRAFQPWEGGEGQALRQHVRSCVKLGRKQLAQNEPTQAVGWFTKALDAPKNLGETTHPLANRSEIYYWLGVASEACGDTNNAKTHWQTAMGFRGDFQEMAVKSFSEHTYYQAMSLCKLGRGEEARKLLLDMLDYSDDLAKSEAKIDYFATSLPTMLIFEDNLGRTQKRTASILRAYAIFGLGNGVEARALIEAVLADDPSNELAADLLEMIGTA